MPKLESIPPDRQSPDQFPAVDYRTRPPRTRTCLHGKLVYEGGAFSHDCIVRDLSPAGAKIVLSMSQPLPLDLYLIIVKHGVAHHSIVRWSKFPARGLRFSNTYSLSEPLPEELRFLRHLWLQLCARSGLYPAADQWGPRPWEP